MTKRVAYLVVVIAALGAALQGFLLTRPGIGISPDSVVYIAAGRSLLAGHGFTMPAANGHDVPLTHFPPGYPIFLAVMASLMKRDFFLAARALNALLFALNTALVTAWLFRRTRSIWLSGLGAVISLSALDLLRVYSMAWSEPLFLLLTFGGFFILDAHLQQASRSRLVAAALLIAAAVMTRYAGIAAIGAGILALFCGQAKPRRLVVQETILFGALAGLPILAWFYRNFLLTHDATNRKLVFHPVWGEMADAARSTLNLWLTQGSLPESAVLWIGVGVLIGSTILWLRFKSAAISPHLRLVAIFSLSYMLLMAAIVFFVEAQLLVPDEYDRILCPLHIALLLTILCATSEARWPRPWLITGRALAIAFASWFLIKGAADARVIAQDGQQFASRDWRTSPTIDYIRRLPAAMHVYTNGRIAVYLYANRSCFEFPPKILLSTRQSNANYEKTMDKIRLEFQEGLAVVVGFTLEDLPQFASTKEWETRLKKSPTQTYDGYVFHS